MDEHYRTIDDARYRFTAGASMGGHGSYYIGLTNPNLFSGMISFFGARVLTLVLEMVIMWFFVTFLKLSSNTWVMIWTIVSQVLVIILNYVFSKLFVFKKRK